MYPIDIESNLKRELARLDDQINREQLAFDQIPEQNVEEKKAKSAEIVKLSEQYLDVLAELAEYQA